eukprot:10932990-Ditylum_brightwellii.AAC.1
MHFHQAMKEPDKEKFDKAIVSQVNIHTEQNHSKLVPRNEVPDGVKILSPVWAIKCKHNIKTGKVYKWKAQVNVHGSQQQKRINYWETYTPVVTHFAVRLLLVLSLLHNWQTRQVDFVTAYPQAPIECDLWMCLPLGIETRHGNSKTHMLMLEKNLY